jgi:hypothetical protein
MGTAGWRDLRIIEKNHCCAKAGKGRRLKLGDTHPGTLESWNNLIDPYEAWNKPEKVEEWQAKLPQTKTVEERHGAAQITPKTPPFSLTNAYNQSTTRRPLIYQFSKNSHLISTVIEVAYKNLKNCARIQWTIPKSKELTTLSTCQPFQYTGRFVSF